MKNYTVLLLIACCFAISSCKKQDGGPSTIWDIWIENKTNENTQWFWYSNHPPEGFNSPYYTNFSISANASKLNVYKGSVRPLSVGYISGTLEFYPFHSSYDSVKIVIGNEVRRFVSSDCPNPLNPLCKESYQITNESHSKSTDYYEYLFVLK